ncbi:MerR family transcriptional regulator [Nocardioides mangrovicus]|uniref:MerR family transcriptional regulator n=1 Tax=Nocardioides mangrovicus TaxID=2478913 RepID=A0A3L8P1S4_9ACTN|nr:helix-turn-helix domain-containing protein [Nocardioides mangrovicus]RLV48559.1 MerR family transcriptional regulator [Nocardioides mangrovicus]
MSAAAAEEGLLTVDELAAATGTTVRNTRYYAGLGLLPPPVRRGRVAYYTPEHRARLELVRALQEHGFTLSAISTYLDRLPDDATVEDLALQRVMLTSWQSAPEQARTHSRLRERARELELPAGSLDAADEAITRHMAALADELTEILRTQVLAPHRRGGHADPGFEQKIARLRELTMAAVVDGFQRAANQVIARSLRRSHES